MSIWSQLNDVSLLSGSYKNWLLANIRSNRLCYDNQYIPCSGSGPKRLGQPGTPGGQDLEAALRSLSARQQSHSSERPFFDVERERKLHALAADCEEAEGSSGFLTPNDSLVSSPVSSPATSTGTNYSNGSSRHSCGSSGGSRSYLPDRLQIVKPLEGKHFSLTQRRVSLLEFIPVLCGVKMEHRNVLVKITINQCSLLKSVILN